MKYDRVFVEYLRTMIEAGAEPQVSLLVDGVIVSGYVIADEVFVLRFAELHVAGSKYVERSKVSAGLSVLDLATGSLTPGKRGNARWSPASGYMNLRDVTFVDSNGVSLASQDLVRVSLARIATWGIGGPEEFVAVHRAKMRVQYPKQ